MSDLEKTPSTQEGALLASAPVAEATPRPEAETPVSEPAAAAASDIEIECNEIAADGEEAARSWHDLSKEELLQALKGIVESGDTMRHRDVAAIKQAFHALRTRELERQMSEFLEAGNAPETFSAPADETEYEFKEFIGRFKTARTEFLAAEEVRLEENLKAKKDIIAKLNNIVEDIDNINVHFPRFQELQAEFKTIKEVTPSAETDIWKEFQNVVELFYDRLKMNKELRDLDFRKNLEVKRELVAKAKSLTTMNDAVAAFRQLQELHAVWRETGPVAKEFRESIWEEFSEASTTINKRHQQYFEDRKATERANEERKIALCEEIEALDWNGFDAFSKWEEMTKKVLDIQARWKALGYASKKVNNQLFARFRETCDKFFTAKADFYKRVKEELAVNLEKKISLCEQVEALLEAEDESPKAVEKVIALQNEWKSIGGVARRQSDAIWHRFTTACNKFFEVRKRQHSAVRKEENDNLAAKRAIIEELKTIDIEKTERAEGIAAVRALQTKWQAIGHVPFRLKDKVFAEYREQCDRIYNGYDHASRRNRRSDFEGRIDALPAGDIKLIRERERLYRLYEQKRGELKTYENNLGFFNVKSKDGNSMVREMEKRIERIKADMADLKKKIELIDDKNEVGQ